MGCFTVMRSRKAKPQQSVDVKRVQPQNLTPTRLPEPEALSRVRVLSAPLSLQRVSPQPQPLPLPPSGSLRSFTYEEDVSFSSRRLEATVTRFYPATQGLKEFVNEVNTLATLQHPSLCKLLGYHVREDSEQRTLVYERLHNGSLDHLLYGRSDGLHIDWSSRVKVAVCAAQGLTFLHEEGPFQAMYNEFSTANIQIDKDFSAKLSGYGCVGLLPEDTHSNASRILTPKSNVYSFGIVLLELLTGRKNMDSCRPMEERNLVKWSWPFLADECRLPLVMDPHLKGRFPIRAARTVAEIALRCLLKDPSERPTMRTVTEQLKLVQEVKYPCRFPLPEPGAILANQMTKMMRSPSLRLPDMLPMSMHTRGCSSLVLDGFDRERQSPASSMMSVRRASVEGF